MNLASRYYGRFTKITTTGKLQITQGVESMDSQNVRGRTVRVQVQLRGLVAPSALWNVGLVQNIGSVDPFTVATFFSAQNADGADPTLAASYAYITPNGAFPADGGAIVGNKIQAAITNSPTWVRVGGCFDVPTTAKNLYVVVWSDSGVAATNGIAIGQACLVNSTAIQNWAPLAYELELLRVQRYYNKSFPIDQLPTGGIGAGRIIGTVAAAGATAGQMFGVRYPVLMWTDPIVLAYNPAAANNEVRNLATGTDATNTTPLQVSRTGSDFSFTGAVGWVVGQNISIQYTAIAEL